MNQPFDEDRMNSAYDADGAAIRARDEQGNLLGESIVASIAATEAGLEAAIAGEDRPVVDHRAFDVSIMASIAETEAGLEAAIAAEDRVVRAGRADVGDALDDTRSGPVDHLAAARAAIEEGDRIRRDIDFHQTTSGGDLDYVAAQRDAAERALRPDPVGAGPRTEAAALALASGWHGELEIADERLDDLVTLYRSRGVVIDIEDDMSVTAADPVTPALGHGQRVAQLHAVVAVNQARHRREELLDAEDAAAGHSLAAADALAADVEAALDRDERALRVDVGSNRDAMALQLAKALTWREASEVAAIKAEELTAELAWWGVRVDVDELSVSIDPELDGHTAQVEAEARAVRVREMAMVEAVAGAALPDGVKTAVGEVMATWSDQYFDSDQAQVYIDREPYRYEDLRAELGKVRMSETDRAAVDFTLAYLREQVEGVDLLDTPVMVDPGVEARTRVPELLDHFAYARTTGSEAAAKAAAAILAEEISVMTGEDQDAAREVGRAIVAGHPFDVNIWPGYVDRDHIRGELALYAMDAAEQRGEADYLAEADFVYDRPLELVGVGDDFGERVERMATRREQLLTIAETGKGLHDLERRQILATLTDIDTGRIADETQLPEVMWVDERSKAEVDAKRGYEPGAELAKATREQVTNLIEASSAVDSEAVQAVKGAVSSIADSIHVVAGGAVTGVENERKGYVEKRDRLGQALVDAGIDRDTKLKVRRVIDDNARQAGQFGITAAERRTRWEARTYAAVTQRDDQNAQRRAVANARAPRGNSGKCANRADRAAQPSSPAPARHSMRRTGSEVER
ncbi:hypothetical protein [Nocardia bovistercoris]|uniref:Uncharacterized protein n=1 Tax=Nocardia bovistercoris TaxID=2785916 RepID=A0A931IEQ9_9NOCA|nr:hypothetical protein [Nocardia bovistercoris]MBH0780342.1 hypothetical protein [Nocardia bovistercoris]